jgi:hypothetical protein
MQLSAEEFADMIDSLQCALRTPKGAEQRRAQRVKREVRMTITPVNDGGRETPVAVLVRDVSAGGIGLLYQRRMPRQARFILRLPRPQEKPLSILCTVMHCQRMGSHLFSVGAEFTRPEDAADD